MAFDRSRSAKAARWLCLLACAAHACSSSGRGRTDDAGAADTTGDHAADVPADLAEGDVAMDAPFETPPDAADASPDASATADASDAVGTDMTSAPDAADTSAPDTSTDRGSDTVPPVDAGGGDARPPPIFSGLSVLAGLPGGSGRADGPGTSARFNNPTALFADGAGNIFVVDSKNHVIRKIVIATGVVSTLAGLPGAPGTTDGTGAGARFSNPRGIAGDGAGHLFVVDGSATIRRIDVATAVVTTFAGMTNVNRTMDGTGVAASFNIPRAIAYDGAGHLLVAEVYVIRKIDVATAAVTTLAGGGGSNGLDGIGNAAAFEDPYAVACDGAGNAFVADYGGATIRKIVIATAEVTTLAGSSRQPGNVDATGSAARFSSPFGVTYDGGNVYVADYGNYAIRKIVVATGAVTTIASDPTGLFYAYAVVADGAGSLFVASNNDHSIRKVSIATGAMTLFAGVLEHRGSTDGTGTAARFYSPVGLADDGAGHLFVADAANSTIRRIVVATGAVTTVAGSPGMRGSINATGAAARFDNPLEMVRTGGDLYITENSGLIRKLTIATAAVTATVSLTPYNYGLAFDGATTLYVSNQIDHTISKASTSGGSGTVIAGTARSRGYVDSAGPAARFDQPTGLAYDGAGNLFVADQNNSVIRRVIVATGVVSTLAGTAGQRDAVDGVGAAARFRRPLALAYDGAGGLFVADTENHTIRWIDIATRTVTTVIGDPNRAEVVLGSLPAGLTAPSGLTVGSGGALYISDENSVLVAR